MTKITDFAALTGAAVDPENDLITAVDMSETGAARNKKMTFAELKTAVGAYMPGGTDVAVADGGTGASTAATARTNLGATTVGANVFTLTNPSAVTFLRVNADNTVDALSAAAFRTAIGAASSGGAEAVTILVTDPGGSAITTGDGKAYFRVPSILNGLNLTSVAAAVSTVSSSGAPTIQIHNVTQAVDMLTTRITIDASETDSSTAATPAVIDTGNDDVATGDLLRIDIDVAGTGAKGLIVEMQFS